MTGTVYVGLCVTSHNAAATTVAVMSGAATTGNVTGSWQVAAVGDDPETANSPANLYVIVQDSAGKTATAINPTAVTSAAWTQWKIPLSSLAGVNMSKVKKITLGVGDRTNPQAGVSECCISTISCLGTPSNSPRRQRRNTGHTITRKRGVGPQDQRPASLSITSRLPFVSTITIAPRPPALRTATRTR